MRFHLQPDPDPNYPNNYGGSTSTLHHMSDALRQSVDRVTSLLIGILPGLVVFILSVAVMTGVGMLLSAGLRRMLAGLKFDERVGRHELRGLADWSPQQSPTALVGRVAFWTCVLLGLLVGVSAIQVSYATGTGPEIALLPFLTRSVGAILLLLAGNVIARYLARTVLIGAVNSNLQYARFLSLGVKWLVLVLTAAMVLDHLRVGGNIIELAFGILFGGIVLTLALAIGLGSRDLVSRSLEKNSDRLERAATAPAPPQRSEDVLRHF